MSEQTKLAFWCNKCDIEHRQDDENGLFLDHKHRANEEGVYTLELYVTPNGEWCQGNGRTGQDTPAMDYAWIRRPL